MSSYLTAVMNQPDRGLSRSGGGGSRWKNALILCYNRGTSWVRSHLVILSSDAS